MGETNQFSSSTEQIEHLCKAADEAARKHITSKVPKNAVSDLSVTIDIEESNRLNVGVEVDLRLSPLVKNVDEQTLSEESVKRRLKSLKNV